MFNICPKDLRAVATADQRPQSTVNVKERYFYLLLFFLGFFLFLFASAFSLWNHCIWKLTYKLVRPSNSLTSRSRNDMWHCCVRATWTCICETKVMCVTPCGWENNEPPSIPCLPKSPNGVRQMGGDQSGVHELSLGMCVCVIRGTCVCLFDFKYLSFQSFGSAFLNHETYLLWFVVFKPQIHRGVCRNLGRTHRSIYCCPTLPFLLLVFLWTLLCVNDCPSCVSTGSFCSRAFCVVPVYYSRNQTTWHHLKDLRLNNQQYTFAIWKRFLKHIFACCVWE